MKSRGDSASKGAPPLCSFRRGLATLTQALAARLGSSLRMGVRVDAVARVKSPGAAEFDVQVARNGGGETLRAQAVVIAAPAHVASHLVSSFAPDLAHRLSGIAYASLAVVGSGYDRRQTTADLDGFGVLIPRSEKHRTLGIVWSSSLFPGRAPAGHMALASFIGGATDPDISRRSEAEIAAIVQKDHETILGIAGAPVASAVWVHPKALPQYNLGHGHIVRAVRDAERSVAGLYFAGNYLEGPSIGKCLECGFAAAENAKAYVESGRVAQAR